MYSSRLTSNIISYVKVYLALFSCHRTMNSLRLIQMLYAKTFMPPNHEISGLLLLFCNGTYYFFCNGIWLNPFWYLWNPPMILCFELELCLILVLPPEAFIVVNLKKIFFGETQYFPWGSEVCWGSDLFCCFVGKTLDFPFSSLAPMLNFCSTATYCYGHWITLLKVVRLLSPSV